MQKSTNAHTLHLTDLELSQGELVMAIQSSKTSSVPAVIRLEARPLMALCQCAPCRSSLGSGEKLQGRSSRIAAVRLSR